MTRTVVHVSDSCAYGGTEHTILQLIGGLDRTRWTPILLHQDEPGAHALRDGARALGVQSVAVRFRSGRHGVTQIPQLASILRILAPRVVHAHLTEPLSCRFALLAAAWAGVPSVIATLQLFMEPRTARLPRLQHRVVAGAVDRYIAVSQHVRSRLEHYLGVPATRIRVIYNAVAVDRFANCDDAPDPRPSRPGKSPIVLTVARLDPQKGHTHLLEAAATLPGVVFLLAGSGSERAALEGQARRLGIGDRVRFLEHRTDIPELLKTADVFVLPSLYEGLPLTVLEAMAAAKPVVATAVGGTDEAVVDGVTGILVPPADPAALSAAIRRILDDPDTAARLGAAGRTRVVSTFSTRRMIRATEQVYEELFQEQHT
jgi:glycosyltransferase involved in cell wall biosynthesis